MKLLKLVPDNTNIDFMRWRNLALVLSILVTVASLAIVGLILGAILLWWLARAAR